jgi:hypothetical protein
MKLEIFFRRQSAKNVWIPSPEFERRKAKYEYDLQVTLDKIAQQRQIVEILWEAGKMNHEEHSARQRELDKEGHEARLKTLGLVHQAEIEDLAQMPRSTFEAMDKAADAYFQQVEKLLGVTGE